MLIQMRSKAAKIITTILFGLLALSFAFWGIGDIFRGQVLDQELARVGDREIGPQEFSVALGREIRRISRQAGGQLDRDTIIRLGIPEQVLAQLVNDATFQQSARDLGLVMTDEQIRRAIVLEPNFHNSLGEFDRARFAQALQLSGLSEAAYTSLVGQDILRNQLLAAVAGAAVVPEKLLELSVAYNGETRIADYILLPREAIETPTAPDEVTLQGFYEEHKQSFLSPEYRRITYLSLSSEDLAQDIGVSEEELREVFESRKSEFERPERRALDQIVVLEEAKAQAIAAKLAEGQSLADAATATSAPAPIDLGVLSQDELFAQLPEVADAVFALKTGENSKPIQTPFGWHIVAVREILPPEIASFESLRTELADEIAMERAIDSLISIANELDDEIASGATLEEAANKLSLSLSSIEAMDAEGRDPSGTAIAELPGGSDFAELAFSTEAGQRSLIQETEDGIYLLRVDGVTPAAPRSMDEVREELIAFWQNVEIGRLLDERAGALANRLRGGESLEDLASELGYSVQRTAPIKRSGNDTSVLISAELPSRLFELEIGGVATASLRQGRMILTLAEIREATASNDPELAEAARIRLRESLRGDLLSAFMQAEQNELGVAVNQEAFDQILRQGLF